MVAALLFCSHLVPFIQTDISHTVSRLADQAGIDIGIKRH